MHKRKSLACSSCNKIVCKSCFGTRWKEGDWKQSKKQLPYWICPACVGVCPCPRCQAKSMGLLPTSIPSSSSTTIGIGIAMPTSITVGIPTTNPPNLNSPAAIANATSAFIAQTQSRNVLTIAFTTFDDYTSYVDSITASTKYSIHDTKQRPFGFNTFISDKVKKIELPTTMLVDRIQELQEKEQNYAQNILELEQLLGRMKKERDQLESEREQLDDRIMNEIKLTSTNPNAAVAIELMDF